MKSFERQSRTRHVVGALAQTPVKGAQVRESQDVLEKITADLTAKRTLHERARDAVRECSARVRDATKAASSACKKARGVLTGEGVAIAPHSADGHSAQDVLSRADVLVTRGSANGVKLPALVAARDVLADAVVARADARRERGTTGDAFDLAQVAWDNAYSALRAAVDSELRREGLRGRTLRARLEAYFPKKVHGHAGAEPTGATPAPETNKPAA